MKKPAITKPSLDTLLRFSRAESRSDESRHVVRWLLASGAVNQEYDPPAYDAAGYRGAVAEGLRFNQGLEQAFGLQAANGADDRLVETVARSATALRASMDTLAADPALQSWGACHKLLDAVSAAVLDDPERAAALASLSIAIMERLLDGTQDHGAGDRAGFDCKALALAHLANARRIQGDLRAAEATFDHSFACLQTGTGDPQIEARVLAFQVSLRRDQRRLDQALRLARRGERLARRVGDDDLRLRLRLKRATVLWHRGEGSKAIETLESALALVTDATEPRVVAVARQNLLSYLIAADRLDEASAQFDEVERFVREVAGPLDQARITWIGARLAAHRGDLARAEADYRRAREWFLARDIGLDAALIDLELAEVYLERGELAKVKSLAATMVPAFAARDIHREAQMALRVFWQAVQADEAGTALAVEVRDYLERSRNDPTLPFRGSV